MLAGQNEWSNLDPLAAICTLETGGERKSFLQQHSALVTAANVEVLAEKVRQSIRVDVLQALREGEAAVDIAVLLNDQESLGRALRAKGNALWFGGDCKAAAELFDSAIRHFQRAGRSDEVGRTLSSSIQPLILLGDYSRALASAAEARKIFTEAGDQLRLSRLDINVANIHHRQENYTEAFRSYERAYETLRALGDHEAVAVALHNMAVCLISLDDFDRALAVYGNAREFYLTHDMPLLVVQADYNIAYLYFLRGDYERALDGLRYARKQCTAKNDRYHLALCDLDEAEIYLELNLAAKASFLAQRAAGRFEALNIRYEAARALKDAGIAFTALGQYADANRLFHRAKELFLEEKHAAGVSLVSLYQSLLCLQTGDLERAGELACEAREYFSSLALMRRVVTCDLVLGRIALHRGDREEAFARCRSALEVLTTLQAPVLAYQANVLYGRIAEVAGQDTEAQQAYRSAVWDMETLRSSLQRDELKIAFVANRIEAYERLVHLTLRQPSTQHAAEEAFGYMEAAKCRSLHDALTGSDFGGRSQPAESSEAGRAARKLRGDLNWFYHRIESEQLAKDGVSQARIAKLWADAKRCENELLDALTDSGEARRTASGPALALSEIQRALRPGDVLLEYFQVDKRFVAAVVSRDGVQIAPLCDCGKVTNSLRMLEFHLSKFRLGSRYAGRFGDAMVAATNAHLQKLYEALLQPLRPLLDGKHLVVVPHGALHSLPFHALYDGQNYLLDAFDVSYAPSASSFAAASARRAADHRTDLIVGIEDESAPWISAEVEAVAGTLAGSRVLRSHDASQQAIRELGASSRYIHIAAHGYFRRDNPMFSGVRLGEQYLSLYDLYSMRLPAELITLSGCSTGLNVVAAGDEVIGLSRGLLCAGAQSLLLSLWDVHDQSTAAFMGDFYRELQAGSGKAAAFRVATLRARERNPHPYFWSPFTLVGKIE